MPVVMTRSTVAPQAMASPLDKAMMRAAPYAAAQYCLRMGASVGYRRRDRARVCPGEMPWSLRGRDFPVSAGQRVVEAHA
jgi:hypothetical protein